MKYLNANSFLFVLACLLFISCDSEKPQSPSQEIINFRKFDLFYLKGIDTLKKVDKHQSVEVKFERQFPVRIKYYMPDRSVTLLLEDSFLVNKNTIYVFTTSNLLGGPPGPHKLYTSHHVEYKDYLHVTLSDTLLCETKDVPPTRNFDFQLFIKGEKGRITQISKGEIDHDEVNAKLSRKQLYLKWMPLLREKYSNTKNESTIIYDLPPP